MWVGKRKNPPISLGANTATNTKILENSELDRDTNKWTIIVKTLTHEQ